LSVEDAMAEGKPEGTGKSAGRRHPVNLGGKPCYNRSSL